MGAAGALRGAQTASAVRSSCSARKSAWPSNPLPEFERSAFDEPFGGPQGFGVRQPSGALAMLGSHTVSESARGLAHSKTLARRRWAYHDWERPRAVAQ